MTKKNIFSFIQTSLYSNKEIEFMRQLCQQTSLHLKQIQILIQPGIDMNGKK